MFVFTLPIYTIVIVLFTAFFFALISNPSQIARTRQVCLTASLLSLAVGVIMCLSFIKATAGFQFLSDASLLSQYNTSAAAGVDGLSFAFLILTLVTFPFLFLTAWTVVKSPKQFFCHLLGMEILLVFTFITVDLFYFFVLFESLLIPMFLLIGTWGARTRKVKAAYYFFLYTLFGSLFMLFGMMYLYQMVGSLNYFLILNTLLGGGEQRIIWTCFFLAFAVKMPLFPFHIWLPEAHVEAPTAGSMLLASLLLKLGGYGFLRFSLTFLGNATIYYTAVVCTAALAGVIYGSLSTLRQIDLKRVIAYSSVAHMNLVVLGVFSYQIVGLDGAIFMMVAHGVVSAALFFIVGVLYDRTHSRLLRYYSGLATTMPLFAAALFVFSLANMSFPGTPNFLGELLIFRGILDLSFEILLLSTLSIVLAASYTVLLYNRLSFGTLKTVYISMFRDTNRREGLVIIVLSVIAVGLGLCGDIVLAFTNFVTVDIVLNQNILNTEVVTQLFLLPFIKLVRSSFVFRFIVHRVNTAAAFFIKLFLKNWQLTHNYEGCEIEPFAANLTRVTSNTVTTSSLFTWTTQP